MQALLLKEHTHTHVHNTHIHAHTRSQYTHTHTHTRRIGNKFHDDDNIIYIIITTLGA